MAEIQCENCGKLFKGRPNRKHCSLVCRNALAVKRKFWDRKFAYVRMCEVNANWECHSPEQRANWKKRGDEAREKLLKFYGERPGGNTKNQKSEILLREDFVEFDSKDLEPWP